jgi:hypothetical protein
MSFRNSRLIKAARKAHRCHWCDQWIDVGESYYYGAGEYEGDFCVTKTHQECEAASNRTMEHNKECSWEAHDHERGKADHE